MSDTVHLVKLTKENLVWKRHVNQIMLNKEKDESVERDGVVNKDEHIPTAEKKYDFSFKNVSSEDCRSSFKAVENTATNNSFDVPKANNCAKFKMVEKQALENGEKEESVNKETVFKKCAYQWRSSNN